MVLLSVLVLIWFEFMYKSDIGRIINCKPVKNHIYLIWIAVDSLRDLVRSINQLTKDYLL